MLFRSIGKRLRVEVDFMKIEWLGKGCDYEDVLALQEQYLEKWRRGEIKESVLLLLEHAPVYTMGRQRDQSSLKNREFLPHPVVEINRGGQATYHGPGQIVGYPILHLDAWGHDIHAYIHGLEDCLVSTCLDYGVPAHRRDGLVGVWVENRKLASLGVGVRHWITMHGFALNLTRESLSGFACITPCGLDGVTMTCLESEMSRNETAAVLPTSEEFGRAFARHFLEYAEKKNSASGEGNGV